MFNIPPYLSSLTFKYSLGIYTSLIKFRCIIRVSADPTVELMQTTNPIFENMFAFTQKYELLVCTIGT